MRKRHLYIRYTIVDQQWKCFLVANPRHRDVKRAFCGRTFSNLGLLHAYLDGMRDARAILDAGAPI